jgi:hypothetical protein
MRSGLERRKAMKENEVVLFRIDRKIGLLLLGASFVVLGGFALAQQLTLTTSYPVPSGIYNQLITTGNSGSVPAVNTIFNQNAGNTILVPATNAGGNVGIGTSAPTAKLDVDGVMRLENAGNVQGTICSTEGTFTYDYANHTPLYCSALLKWQQPGAAYGGLFEAGSHGSNCQAPNPLTHACSCPAGYSMTATWANDSSGTSCQTGMGVTNPGLPYPCANMQFLCHL